MGKILKFLTIPVFLMILSGCGGGEEEGKDADAEDNLEPDITQEDGIGDRIELDLSEVGEEVQEDIQDIPPEDIQAEDVSGDVLDVPPPPPCEAPPPPAIGTECHSSSDCSGEHPRCFSEDREEFNGEEYVSWMGGYCAETGTGTTVCDIDDPVATCPEGMKCMYLYDWGTSKVYGCMDACYPEKTGTNPPELYDFNCGCREGYYCNITNGVCLPGCSHNRECCEVWRDLNSNYERDEGEVEVVTGCTNWCDNDPSVDGGASYACINEGTPGAEFSGSCIHDSQCPADGRCLDPINYTDNNGNPYFPGGYCLKDRCDASGRDCGGGNGHCANLGTNDDPFWACVKACHVGDDPDSTGFPCRQSPTEEKMTCMPLFVETPFLDTNDFDGYCWYGNFTTVTQPNYERDCSAPQDCWSPLGLGNCYTMAGTSVSFCSVICTQDLAENHAVCGANGEGVCWASQTALCWKACDTPRGNLGANGCPLTEPPAWACYPTADFSDDVFVATGASLPAGFCFPACKSDSWCSETFGTSMTCDSQTGICR